MRSAKSAITEGARSATSAERMRQSRQRQKGGGVLVTIDLDATSIRGLERGTSNPTWDVADRVARALGLSLHELARMADELETTGRQPTNRPLRQRA